MYEIDRQHPTEEPWTAQDPLIDALDFLYATTEQLITDRTRALGSVIDEAPSESNAGLRAEQSRQAVLKRQMTELAAALCINMEDKCRTVAT